MMDEQSSGIIYVKRVILKVGNRGVHDKDFCFSRPLNFFLAHDISRLNLC
jgi:hypothetical protein